jgi:hypothetical protein
MDQQSTVQEVSGSISGTVVDASGASVTGAQVKLTNSNPTLTQVMRSGEDGEFSFAAVAPGPFQLTVTAVGFAPKAASGILNPGESSVLPQIVLPVAGAITRIQVEPSSVDVAEEQIKEQEKQRVLGVVPNFYVSYVPNAQPLTSKQKFQLALKTTIDPVNLILTGAVAGVEQAQNNLAGYGQGAQGYAKRYGANYGDSVAGTFIGSAILPSLLKQDPRYFYKGVGSARARLWYAIANSVICKGDNGHWQPNYSSVLGNIAAGGISNLYYPATSRNGTELTFANAAIGIGANAAANILQEFVIRKLTSNVPNPDPVKP